MTYAIKAENLGKCYRIGHQKREPYSTLRDSITGGLKGIFHKISHPSLSLATNAVEDFWALKDVSFEIQPGDRIGIIGRNGAGKSTLLKILSRITEPTTGRFTTRGRVASLLEVGTGFHPELSGRENIYLNGAILGMTKADVKKHFDAIVDFSGVEKFLDTPVKRYSSGMYVRLAFAVAAHLDPDILIVDEVLAVGDAEFQKKCLGKMEEVGKDGRTVVFVSHNMGAVRNLCSDGLFIQSGNASTILPVQQAIDAYTNQVSHANSPGFDLSNRNDRKGNFNVKIISIKVKNGTGSLSSSVTPGEPVRFQFEYESAIPGLCQEFYFAFNVRSASGDILFNCNTKETGSSIVHLLPRGTFECLWPDCTLREGQFFCTVFCSINGEIADWITDAFTITVVAGDYFQTGLGVAPGHSLLYLKHSWTF